MLYKEGDEHVIWGDIPCTYKVVDPLEVESHVADGWKRHPTELYRDDKADTDGDGDLSLDEAKKYLDGKGVDYAGLHWKKVVALAKEKAVE